MSAKLQLGSYVVETNGFFSYGHTLFDIKTGKERFSFTGMPLVSPGGKFIVDFFNFDDPEYNEDTPFCKITITERIDNNRYITRLSHSSNPLFVSWDENEIFWVSNNELIVRLYKLTPYHAGFTDHRNKFPDWKPQYVKLKIVPH